MNIDLVSVLQGGKRTFSFMFQTLGLMADLDLDTEHLRWLGDNRFVYGYLRGGEHNPRIRSSYISLTAVPQ